MFGFDEAIKLIKKGKKVKRQHWGGYWYITPIIIKKHKETLTTNRESQGRAHVIMAVLKDNGGYAPATAYQEDLLAEDWSEVE